MQQNPVITLRLKSRLKPNLKEFWRHEIRIRRGGCKTSSERVKIKHYRQLVSAGVLVCLSGESGSVKIRFKFLLLDFRMFTVCGGIFDLYFEN